MKKGLFIFLFFTGFQPFALPMPRKYFLIQQEKAWSDARAYCKAVHTDLAVVDSDANTVRFQSESQKQQVSSTAWVGLYNDFNYWRWSFNDVPLGSWRPWASRVGEPDNAGGKQECGVIHPSGWGDAPCELVLPFMCFDAGLTGTGRFTYYPTGMTWLGAQTHCRTYHTDLATVTDTAENSIVLGKVNQWTFFGLYRFPWRWLDSTKLSNFVWATGQPDNYQRNENCVYLYNAQLVDALCSSVRPFFCYSVHYPVVTIKQLIRVKVQSGQDANDPAVKAAILDKIQEILKKHGPGNVAVKFRKREDGKEFH